jgi:glutamate synthase domain-containing protein 3
MARICEKNTCPTGIATHDPKFKTKYKGSPEHVKRILRAVAEDVRQVLAAMGKRSLQEVIGRTDLLQVAEAHAPFVRERKLSLDFFMRGPVTRPRPRQGGPAGETAPLNRKIVEATGVLLDAGGTIELDYEITTADRGIPATLAGEISERVRRQRLAGSGAEAKFHGDIRLGFRGSAGQGFGAFMVDGVRLVLRGEANDSVCKSMSGGKVVILPFPDAAYKPEENAIIGHCALYGATGGTLYVHGYAGDRFAVRNSGATAVVEGVGLHACEYMTRGVVLILGPVSHNVGAGMTGGAVYIKRENTGELNTGYVVARDFTVADAGEFLSLLQGYHSETGSTTARTLLEAGTAAVYGYVRCVPVGR